MAGASSQACLRHPLAVSGVPLGSVGSFCLCFMYVFWAARGRHTHYAPRGQHQLSQDFFFLKKTHYVHGSHDRDMVRNYRKKKILE